MSKVNFIDASVRSFTTPATKPLTEEQAIWIVGLAAGTAFNSSKDWDKVKARVKRCIEQGHHSVLEHANLSLEIVTDRGTSHALVRHRHCAFTQSSTIYQKSKDMINIIRMPDNEAFDTQNSLLYEQIQFAYEELAKQNPAGVARDILPNAYATKLIMTTNLREWYFILNRRDSQKGDAPRMWLFDKQLNIILRSLYPNISEWMKDYYSKHPI